MALPRPSLTLIADVDETLDTEETRLEIGRCYTHVGTTVVRGHAAAEPPSNTMRMLVKLGTRRYLARDAASESLWNDVMERWLANRFRTVSNNMLIFNRRQREIGAQPLVFDRLEVELENGAFTAVLRLDSASGLPDSAAATVSRMRAAYADGLLGENVVRVCAPSDASYEEQREAGRVQAARRVQERARREAEEQAAEEERRRAAEERAQEGFLESPELLAEKRRVEGGLADGADSAVERVFELDEPDFEPDYRIWTVVAADGSERTFDSSSVESEA